MTLLTVTSSLVTQVLCSEFVLVWVGDSCGNTRSTSQLKKKPGYCFSFSEILSSHFLIKHIPSKTSDREATNLNLQLMEVSDNYQRKKAQKKS